MSKSSMKNGCFINRMIQLIMFADEFTLDSKCVWETDVNVTLLRRKSNHELDGCLKNPDESDLHITSFFLPVFVIFIYHITLCMLGPSY